MMDCPRMAMFLNARAGSAGCWEFRKSADKDGYGRVLANGRTHIAHRVAYALAKGPIPDGLFVLHSCDNPPCCNPAHLFLGTAKDNAADALAKGRFVMGSRNGSAKLTEDQVRAIRIDPRRQIDIAAEYGIDQTTVSTIKTGLHWRHVA